MSRPPLTTALLAVPGGAVVAASTAILIVLQAYVVPVVSDPSIDGGVGNPAIAVIALLVGSFLGAGFGAIIGCIVAGGLVLGWATGVPDRIGVPLTSIVGVAATVGLMTTWLTDDVRTVLLALSGSPRVVGGVALLAWLGRREVVRGRRFFEK
ncbi:hypothetical protein N1028_11245 [Herbiconiux sp. CPCC 203407]|uniref:Uncharacterized protein n=1 Tax=Herbiconiux oxytropis TaxID=2970915 RepID=A0AA41XIE7_9MICO|nr:hypothetical protein [Herbiconiux oxytropis]MCS5722528.1 hypothetical protein [Herbiconiux oxytropis]MCS5726468.1 hypothetical protein [Herbiconiux oxytropis]